MTISQTQLETNEGLLGAQLMTHLKSYISLFVANSSGLQDIDIAALSAQVAEVTKVLDGDPESEGYQAFQSLLTDIATLKGDNTTNQSRLTAAESALNTMDTLMQQEFARVESESKSRDALIGQRIDGIQQTMAKAGAERLLKDNEHDGKISALEAFRTNMEAALTAEVNRALEKEAELKSSIDANTGEIDVLKQQANTFATRENVSSGMLAFCQGAEKEMWKDTPKPSDVPSFTP